MSAGSSPNSATTSTRRAILGVGAATFVGAAGGSCSFFQTEPTQSDGKGSANREQDPPMLAEQVRQGKLPPREDRIPENPLVLEPVAEIGAYGGDWRTVLLGPADVQWVFRTVGYDQLLTWNRDFTAITPNLAESVESNDDGTVFTVKLRRGVKWSDGAPFSASDIVFAYEDVIGDVELFPTHPGWLSAGGRSGGEPGRVEQLDDNRVRFTFAEPNGLFPTNLAALPGANLTTWPRHYLEQFHRKYNPRIEQQAEDEGHPSWIELFDAKGSLSGKQGLNHWSNPDLPTLTPWRVEQALGDGRQFVVVRNPYYWKVDPEGRQLPYLDRVVFDVVEDEEVLLVKIGNGEIDMHTRHVMIPQNKPVLAAGRSDGEYEFLEIATTDTNQLAINLNLNHRDAVLGDIFRTKEFRVALSHAINRTEMIDVVFQRQGEPWQLAPRPEAPFFDEGLAKQYTEYDPDLANTLLDRIGLTERDGDGFRLRPDGARLRFSLDVPVGSLNPAWLPGAEMVKEYWSEVGIDVGINAQDRSLFWERMTSAQHDATVWDGQHGMRDAPLIPITYLPAAGHSQFAPLWGQWYVSGGEGGEEPPAGVREQLELFDRVKSELDDERRYELFADVLAMSREQFYSIGIALPPSEYGIVRTSFANVPEVMPGAWAYPTPAPTRPEQYFKSTETE